MVWTRDYVLEKDPPKPQRVVFRGALKATPHNGARRFGKRSAEARSTHLSGVALKQAETANHFHKNRRMTNHSVKGPLNKSSTAEHRIFCCQLLPIISELP